MNPIYRTLCCTFFGLLLITSASTQAPAKTINPSRSYDIEYIKYDSKTLHIKLTPLALSYGWLSSGATQLAKQVIWLVEKDGLSCFNVKVSKLARQIQLHCIANTLPLGNLRIPYIWSGLKNHANPVDIEWRQLS
jgi:hypothetical protein